VNDWLRQHLACPRDRLAVSVRGDVVRCAAGHEYVCFDGIPIMLVEEAAPTHVEYERSVRAARDIAAGRFHDDLREKLAAEGIGVYVQQAVAATCGGLYAPLIGKLPRYPIPELRLPAAQRGESFLDIGCNWGRWSISAARHGYTVIGIDPSLRAVRWARKVAEQCGVAASYVVGDARRLPFRDGAVDVAFSYSVLQHFSRPDAMQALAQIGRVLAAGGASVVQMANGLGPRNMWVQLRRGLRERAYFDVHYWSPRSLRRAFEGAIGPSALEADGFFSLNPQASDLDLLRARHRLVVTLSERLRKLSRRWPWLVHCADSVYVTSRRAAAPATRAAAVTAPGARC
jgi:SAM-dependent methyltransferase